MSNIKPILNLNKHPKDCENLSLVNARNIQISDDLSVIENERSIIINKFDNDIRTLTGFNTYKIVGAIPCNTEIIFFVIETETELIITNNGVNCYIIRCNEEYNESKLVTNNYKYFGGQIIGTFTYNSRNELILGVSEYDALIDIPLKSFNIGTWENNSSEDINLSYDNLSIVPTVKLPEFTNVKFEGGKANKGWYNFFIRFKINKNDYTQWYPIGYSIYLGSLETVNMFKVYGYSGTSDKFVTGFTDSIDGETDYSNETISFVLNSIKEYNPEYSFYQVAYVCSKSSSNYIRRTEDISIDVSEYKISQENFNKEVTLEELTNSYYNYYNVKNVINYQNRLYIANYKEKQDIENIDEIISNIKLSCKVNYIDRKDLLFNLWNNSSQYFSENRNSVTISDAYNIKEDEQIILGLVNNQLASHVLSRSDRTYCQIVYSDQSVGFNAYFDRYTQPTHVESDNCGIWVNNQLTYKGYETLNIIRSEENIYTAYYRMAVDIKGKTYELEATGSNILLNGSTIPHNMFITKNTFDTTIGTDINGNAKDFSIVSGENGGYIINNITNEEYTGSYTIIINGNVIDIIDLSDYKNNPFIDANKSFKERKLDDTLIPGEIYSFYIHFIDKYGEATKGYKLSNNYTYKYNNKEIVPIGFTSENGGMVLALIPLKNKIFNADGSINIPNGTVYLYNLNDVTKNDTEFTFNGLIDTNSNNETYSNNLKQKVIELNPSIDAYWEDLPDGIGNMYYSNTLQSIDYFLKQIEELGFIKYTNSNKDNLFKVPDLPIITTGDGKQNMSTECDTYSYNFPIVKLNIENITIPNGYIGYFISYEKSEQTIKNVGILTNADFINYDIEENKDNGFINHNKSTTNKIYFYSSKFDINEEIDVNYSFMDIASSILFDTRNKNIVVNELNSNFKYYNLNNPILGYNPGNAYKVTRINNYNVVAGGDITKGRNGLGTALQLDNQYNLFSENEYKFYYARLIFINHNIYTSTNKTLIKLTDYIYNDNDRIIEHGYNGYHTYDGICCYNANKIIMNTGSTKVVNEIFKNYDNKYPLAAYFQFPLIDTYFNETKSFNNKPQFVSTLLNSVDDLDKKDQLGEFAVSSYISPENSIDTYKNNYIDKDKFIPKFYDNYNKDLEYLYHFTKYVRRSNIIQDESLINAWRQFPLEGYKIITENKGIITNLVGIGTILLVHCEHSMFMFDRDNTLNTIDKSVQLQMPDIFDVDYKEVFTSDLGFGGLQDKFAWIVDQFGYIFYDNSNNRFYKFDNGQLSYIDKDIINFVKQYKPYKIRFGNDTKRTRLLINVEFDINEEHKKDTLSYNYNTNNFVSWHDIKFEIAYSTKSNLYLINRNITELYVAGIDKLLSFDENNNYGCIKIIDNNTKDIRLEFIINNDYNLIKYLEYITYKLYILNMFNIDNYDKHINERKQPFSGQRLRVYNDLIDTGELNILIDDEQSKNIFGEYKKPYWDLGNWNFSYLRNAKDGQSIAELMSRLYGNYFIISFTLNNKIETNKIEFEDINYVISKDKRI